MFGKTACDAGELALRALAKGEEKKADALDKLNSDSKESKVNDVKTEPPQNNLSEKERIQQAVKNLKEKKQKLIEGK